MPMRHRRRWIGWPRSCNWPTTNLKRVIPCTKIIRAGLVALAAGCAACCRARPVLQHRRSFGPVDPRCVGQHERQAAERRNAHRGRAARDQGRGRASFPRRRSYRCACTARSRRRAGRIARTPISPCRSAPASAAGGAITAAVDGAKAQGYTPIAYSLGQAANDFPADAKERVIVLVSDGKETCQGDPVVAARALAAKGITVHTVGFIVDTAARGQLQAIARATGGTYFDAPVGPELPDTLKQALNACAQRVVTLPAKPKPGKLRTTSAIYYSRHLQCGDRPEGRDIRPHAHPGRAAGGHLRGQVRTGKLEGDRGALRARPPRSSRGS